MKYLLLVLCFLATSAHASDTFQKSLTPTPKVGQIIFSKWGMAQVGFNHDLYFSSNTNFFNASQKTVKGSDICDAVHKAAKNLFKDGCAQTNERCILVIAIPRVTDKESIQAYQYEKTFYQCAENAIIPLKKQNAKVMMIGLTDRGVDRHFIRWITGNATDASVNTATGVSAFFLGQQAQHTLAVDDAGNSLAGNGADIAAEYLWLMLPKPIEICQGSAGCSTPKKR